MSMKKRLTGALVSLLLVSFVVGCGASNSTGPAAPSGPQQWSSEPAMAISTNKNYDAVVDTNYGKFTIHLFAKDAPHMVNNFVFLANHNFYHNCTFFRIIQSFMIQTGDPLNNGTGGPGYTVADELPVKHPYAPGIVAMANRSPQVPNTNGSQFFICTGADSQNLNSMPYYTQIGDVTKGMNVVEAIAKIPVVDNSQGEKSSPTKVAKILSVTITETP